MAFAGSETTVISLAAIFYYLIKASHAYRKLLEEKAEVFGDDVNDHRPERLLEADKEKATEMKGTMLHFRIGARTCIGKNVSLLALHKPVPSLLRRLKV
ncbi:MAG: hypothetical protein Q9184_000429 [Pyrenodesmia sp. 2 TL-2023]